MSLALLIFLVISIIAIAFCGIKFIDTFQGAWIGFGAGLLILCCVGTYIYTKPFQEEYDNLVAKREAILQDYKYAVLNDDLSGNVYKDFIIRFDEYNEDCSSFNTDIGNFLGVSVKSIEYSLSDKSVILVY